MLAVCSSLLSPVGPARADNDQTGPVTDQGSLRNLGASDLPENRAVRTLAPGVILTKVSRGVAEGSLYCAAEVAIPSDSPDPDAPSSALTSQALSNGPVTLPPQNWSSPLEAGTQGKKSAERLAANDAHPHHPSDCSMSRSC